MNKLGSQYAGGLLVAKDGELTVQPSAPLTQLNNAQVDTIRQLSTYTTNQHNWLTAHENKVNAHAGQLGTLATRVNALDDAQYKGVCALSENAWGLLKNFPGAAVEHLKICQSTQRRDDCTGNCVWLPRP